MPCHQHVDIQFDHQSTSITKCNFSFSFSFSKKF
jgi:hypothetical protein